MLIIFEKSKVLRRMYWGCLIAFYMFGMAALIHSVRWW